MALMNSKKTVENDSTMDERVFAECVEHALARIEVMLEAAGLEYDLSPGGVLEVELEDGSQMVINRQAASREIWVAARSGGFHFRWNGVAWLDTRSGETLEARLERLMRGVT